VRTRIPFPAEEAFAEIDGTSVEIRELKDHMRKVAADGDVTVLILGESGTGKERVARAIHRASPRGAAPFVVVNCAGLSATLVEDELFGHVRGAFTGALYDHPGPFERASGGTVFLDEVGDLSPELQMKLLRALQQRTIQRLGSRHETAFDVRVIAATNVDLARAKERGRLREDLYYRLKVYELRVPPLRRRGPSDIRDLATGIVRRLCARRQRPCMAIGEATFGIFSRYRWPGNVRELENTLERMVVAAGPETPLRGAATLLPEHLPEDFGWEARRIGESLAGAGSEGTSVGRPAPSETELRAALERNRFSRRRTATELGLSRHQLYRLLKRSAVLPLPGVEEA
jgi:two-component system, NtrC family, response regulator HydG